MILKLVAIIMVVLTVLAAPTLGPQGIAISLTKHSSLPGVNKNVTHMQKFIPRVIFPSADEGVVQLENHKDVDETYYGTIFIGTPAKPFTVEFDTGSSDLFIPALAGNKYCRSHHNLYNPTSSPSSRPVNKPFTMKFADGAIVRGQQYVDKVTIAGFTADRQIIGIATEYSSEMDVSEFPSDGMLGLAFGSLSTFPATPLLFTLFKEGRIPQPMFSLKLTDSGGELYIGGTNRGLYIESSLFFVPVINAVFWELKIDSIKVNDEIVLIDVPAIIDTGSNNLFGDKASVLALHQVKGGKFFGDGLYTFPCRSFPSVTLTIGGRPLVIPQNILDLGRVETGSRDCFSGISTHEEDQDSWTIGTILLKRYYTVFDFGSNPPQIGFAGLARTSPT